MLVKLSLLLVSSILLANDTQFFCADPKEYIVKDDTQSSTYKNCKRDGMTYWYTDTGAIKSQVNFIEGKENGVYTSFYDNGAKKLVVNYTDGQKDGLQRIYFDNGVVGSEVNYVMGRREGVMKEWDIEGYLESEVYYKNNYKVGLKKYYDHQGNVTKTETYKMDRNPVMQKLLKDKREEIYIDLSKYGLVPKDAPKDMRIK